MMITDKQLNDPEWLKAEYGKGRSLEDIAQELGVHRNTVRNRFVKFNLERRPKTAHLKGTPKSAEHRAKISAAKKRYWQEHPATDEFRLKISRTKTGGKGEPSCRYAATGDERVKILEHRLIIERQLGRRLTDEECVHHIDNDRLNNDPNNLLLIADQSEHMRLHRAIQRLRKQKKPIPDHQVILDSLRG